MHPTLRVVAVVVAALVYPFSAHGQSSDDAALDIVVVEESAAETHTHATTRLDAADLDRAAGQDLAESLSGVAGVTHARCGADNAKPIIRGQQERRLLLLYDGVRHESQKWGLDHAPEVDPFSAGAIEVVRGAAGVRYGPDAIGGVVLVEPKPMRSETGVDGEFGVVGVSNGRRGVVDVRLDGMAASTPGLSWRLHGNLSKGADLQTPTYVLGNTASQVWNADASVQQTFGRSSVKASYRHYDLSAGLCYCASNTSLDALRDPLALDQPVGSEDWVSTYEIGSPRQQVTHDLAMVRGVFGLANGAVIRATYAFQVNHREEFEPTRGEVDTAQYDFSLRTHLVDGAFVQQDRVLGEQLTLEGGFGVDAGLQENIYQGLPLIPNFRSLSAGMYAHQRLVVEGAAVELGGRYDHQSRTSYLTSTAFRAHEARGTLAPEDCSLDDDVQRCGKAYNTASVSVGGIWHLVPDAVDLRLDLSSASRFPSADELYMNGSAPTSPVYAIGDPGLGVETTWASSPTVGAHWRSVWVEASTFANYTRNYIQFAPSLDPTGAPAIDVTIRGAFPRYGFSPIDAVFYGVDGQFVAGEDELFEWAVQGAVVRAVDVQSGQGLVGIPPDQLSSTVAFQPQFRALKDPYLTVGVDHMAEQTRVPDGVDLAPPPPAYTLVNAGLGTRFEAKRRTYAFGVEVHNLLNTRYRSYTSLLRYFTDEPGREFRVRLGFEF